MSTLVTASRPGDRTGGLVFLQTDPVEGGNANAYVYPQDPINGSDLTGLTRVTGDNWGWTIESSCYSPRVPRRSLLHRIRDALSSLYPTAGLRKQLRLHEEKLRAYESNPLLYDNKGVLRRAIESGNFDLAHRIYEGRIASLRHQIENFRGQIQAADDGPGEFGE